MAHTPRTRAHAHTPHNTYIPLPPPSPPSPHPPPHSTTTTTTTVAPCTHASRQARWDVRWFELGADGCLKYYPSSEEAKEGAPPSGEIDVADAFSVERPDPTVEAPHALIVRTEPRHLYLRVNNEAKLSVCARRVAKAVVRGGCCPSLLRIPAPSSAAGSGARP